MSPLEAAIYRALEEMMKRTGKTPQDVLRDAIALEQWILLEQEPQN
jgi:hypothetical protein